MYGRTDLRRLIGRGKSVGKKLRKRLESSYHEEGKKGKKGRSSSLWKRESGICFQMHRGRKRKCFFGREGGKKKNQTEGPVPLKKGRCTGATSREGNKKREKGKLGTAFDAQKKNDGWGILLGKGKNPAGIV